MPWTIEARNDEWCVVKESDGKSVGCHASRSQALLQQRALYAQEAQTASLVEAPAENGKEQVRINIGSDVAGKSMDEAIAASMSAISERLAQTEEVLGSVVVVLKQISDEAHADRKNFERAITASLARQDPVVNVSVPETVVNVPAPIVNVELPVIRKKIELERDFDGTLLSATISEEEDGG